MRRLPFSFTSRAWRRETLRSVRRMVLPSCLPMVISSRTSGTTVLRPSSSSMMAFNAFALWNVGGALERAVRPADYLAVLVFTALGTTLASAVGADSISLGASGIAFGLLGAAATFGWRRGVRGPLRSYFGLRIVPWLLALFAAGLGSQGVDNWGHAGGLVVGAAFGFFLTPRAWPGEAAARRIAAAAGAVLGTLSLGVIAA